MKIMSMPFIMAKKTDGHSRPAGAIRRWLHFAFCLLLLWTFIFVLGPMLQQKIPAIGILGNYIEESGIDAGAIYYTEVEEVGESDLAIRNTFRFYLPKK
jgi:hypothetical protein